MMVTCGLDLQKSSWQTNDYLSEAVFKVAIPSASVTLRRVKLNSRLYARMTLGGLSGPQPRISPLYDGHVVQCVVWHFSLALVT